MTETTASEAMHPEVVISLSYLTLAKLADNDNEPRGDLTGILDRAD